MKLKDLLKDMPILSACADMDREITGVSYDSRTTAPGDLFVAIAGEAADGHRFIPMAMEMGIDPVAWVVVVAVGTNLAIATPIGTAVNMQILPAGYTFKDFALLGGPLWLLMTIVVTICSVLFLI